MSGTQEGGLKAAAKNIAQNPNFYKEIGRKGGQNGHTGGFTDQQLAKQAGALGGWNSKRGHTKIGETDELNIYLRHRTNEKVYYSKKDNKEVKDVKMVFDN